MKTTKDFASYLQARAGKTSLPARGKAKRDMRNVCLVGGGLANLSDDEMACIKGGVINNYDEGGVDFAGLPVGDYDEGGNDAA